jgi:hypothetical protein
MGAYFAVDESQPHQTGGSYLARSLHGWNGTAFFVWVALKASLLMSIRTRLWVPETAIACMYCCIPTLAVGALAFVLNIFYFGPVSKRPPNPAVVKNATIAGDQERAVSPLGRADRLGRLGNDQWLITAFTASTMFILTFMLIFYNQFGEYPFKPLSVLTSPTGTQTDLRGVVWSLIDYLIGTCGMALVIVLCTNGDTIKRLVRGGELQEDSGEYAMMAVNDGAATGSMAHEILI